MLFPKPQRLTLLSGEYLLKNEYKSYSLVEFHNLIKAGNQDVSVNVIHGLAEEEYILKITPSGIELSASSDVGIFRAATSLWQLIRKQGSRLAAVEIEDKPQFARRGYLFDITRGRIPKPETFKELIDFLATLKYNEFQIYMEAEGFDYSAYPELTANFDCLTPEDIKDLENYCAERFIDLVPNQNSLGHMELWLKHDRFKHLGLTDGSKPATTINPLLPESLEVIENIYDSLLPLFKSEFVNVGLDEAFGLGKFQMAEYTEKHGKDIAFMEWLNKLNDIISKKYNKKVMFWSDMIYKFERTFNMIPKDAILLEWGYELIQSQIMTEHAITFKNAGFKYYLCPSVNTHNSLTGRFDVTSFNIRTAAEIGEKHGAMGLLLTDWGNAGHPQHLVWSLVPAALFGQYAWNVGAEQDGETFKADFIHASERYVDEFVFGGAKVSRLMYRMCNYYLLEPERVHVGTMCGHIIAKPISETQHSIFFDLKDTGDEFYFNNLIEYVTKVMKDFEAVEFDNQMKREIILNSRMVLFSAELCKLRVGCELSSAKRKELIELADWILAENEELWKKRNYEIGMEIFQGIIKARRAELEAM